MKIFILSSWIQTNILHVCVSDLAWRIFPIGNNRNEWGDCFASSRWSSSESAPSHWAVRFVGSPRRWKLNGRKGRGGKKPSRTRKEQFAHDNTCDSLHHNGSRCFGDVSLVSSRQVSEQLMRGTGCNRSSCPGRAGAKLLGVQSHDTRSRLRAGRENGTGEWAERSLTNLARNVFFFLKLSSLLVRILKIWWN